MRKMTEANLKDAFAGESQAHMKYLAFAEKAEKEGKEKVAKLFRAIAYAEQVHATNHLRALSGIGNTVDNLETAIGGENFEVEEMYPAYDAVAKLQGEQDAIRSIHYAIEAEKIHASMYSDAKNTVQDGADISIESVYICPVCGFTVIDDAPDFCPVCSVPKSKFKVF